MVSVIVPVYNTKPYLKACVESVLCQTYKNLELILVDDGSTDGSGAVCDSFAAANERRVRVIHQSNRGASAARNAGVEVAQGELIAFIDSDDTVYPTYIEVLVDLKDRYGADIASVFVADGKGSCGKTFYTGVQAMKIMLYQTGCFDSSPCKLFSAALVRACRFDESYRVYEDMEWLSRLLHTAHRIVCSNLSLYNYYKQPSGTLISRSPYSDDPFRVMDSIDRQLAAAGNASLVKAARSRRLSLCFNILRLLSAASSQESDMISCCWQQIVRLRCRCFFDPHIRMKNRLGILLSLPGKRFLMKVFAQMRAARFCAII